MYSIATISLSLGLVFSLAGVITAYLMPFGVVNISGAALACWEKSVEVPTNVNALAKKERLVWALDPFMFKVKAAVEYPIKEKIPSQT